MHEDTWYNHILAGHRSLHGHEATVARVLANPYRVMHDSFHDNRECFYLQRTHPRFPELLLKVCVEFETEYDGLVITAYVTPRDSRRRGAAMAVSATDHIDPTEEFVPRHIDPKPFRREDIDPAKIVVSYDRRSDTLLIHLFGRGLETISVPVAKYLYVMVTPDTETVVGFHIEGFLGKRSKTLLKRLPFSTTRSCVASPRQRCERCNERRLASESGSWDTFAD